MKGVLLSAHSLQAIISNKKKLRLKNNSKQPSG